MLLFVFDLVDVLGLVVVLLCCVCDVVEVIDVLCCVVIELLDFGMLVLW